MSVNVRCYEKIIFSFSERIVDARKKTNVIFRISIPKLAKKHQIIITIIGGFITATGRTGVSAENDKHAALGH